MSEQVRENRLRRMATRQGLVLEKCRRRDPRSIGYGTFRLVRDIYVGQVWIDREIVASDGSRRGYGLSLDQVESYLLHN
ncbi:hypothetical protein GCM10010472_04090 [Pseudonocardia halophobica]|uniref:Uncharacterized protein n=1 Tax=Pseudonocardia halophobica TaxID=29401 RepID=A0A9W6L5D7_9PSEU|nr:hypothetical protein [Pseudonocardia halophobica]GLL13368.1 hypothetical protein GCM10017577_45110 [Pseudonocardia halophobica]